LLGPCSVCVTHRSVVDSYSCSSGECGGYGVGQGAVGDAGSLHPSALAEVNVADASDVNADAAPAGGAQALLQDITDSDGNVYDGTGFTVDSPHGGFTVINIYDDPVPFCTHMRLCVRICMLYVCVYVRIHAYIYIYIYMYIYIYIYI